MALSPLRWPLLALAGLGLLALGLAAGWKLGPGLLRPKKGPAAVVERQCAATNARDLEAFTACFSEDAVVCVFPEQVTGQGREALRQEYGELFKDTALRSRVLHRRVYGSRVIDDEQVTTARGTLRGTAVYDVQDGLIRKVTFVAEP